MKKILKSVFIYFFLLLSIGVSYAAWNTLVSSGETLTSVKFNDVVNKLISLDNDVVTLSGSILGAAQTRQDVTGSRLLATNYTNSTGAPIQVSIILNASGTQQRTELVVGGVSIARITPSDYYSPSLATAHHSTITGIIPPGTVYSLQIANGGTPTIISWLELR